jgi:hypothetical protein
MEERRATCTCGQLFIRCRGEPEIISSCHCFACQHRTGSIFGVAAFYSRANIIETGGQSTKFSRKGERGYSVTSHFCPICGSTVYWEREMPADHIGISVGSFADPAFPKPKRAIWTQNKHHWVVLPDEIVQIPQNP